MHDLFILDIGKYCEIYVHGMDLKLTENGLQMNFELTQMELESA